MGLLDDAIKEHLDLRRRHGADPADVERAEREALGPVRRAPTAQEAEMASDSQTGGGVAYDQQDEAGWKGERPEADSDLSGYRAARDQEFESEFDDEEDLEPEPEPKRASRPSRLARIFGKPDREPEPEPEPELDLEADYPEPEHDEPGFGPPGNDPARHKPGLPASGSEERPLGEPAFDPSAPAPAPARRPAPSRAPTDPLDDPETFIAPQPSAPPRSAPAPGTGDETAQYDVERTPDAGEPGSASAAPDEDVLEETPEFLQDTPDHDRLWFEQRPPRDFNFEG